MIYDVTHRTAYSYADRVDLAYHQLHLHPRAFRYQRVLGASIDIVPKPRRVVDYLDHFGNHISYVTLEEPHVEFEVTLHAAVDVAFPQALARCETPAWEVVAAALAGPAPEAPFDVAEFAQDSPLAPAVAELRDYAARFLRPGRPILPAVRDLTAAINADFAYDPTATDIATPIQEVIEARRGVCQDFAHVQVAALRSFGLAARYVSGYIRSGAPADPDTLIGGEASHAWISVWCGPAGWIDFDPTNDKIPTDEHVVVAWGRDFSDVSPIHGIILGGGAHTLDVAVTVVPKREAGR